MTLVAVGALMLAWLLEVPRLLGEVGALAGIAAYVLAVGPQPSVIRAGVVGALGSLAWIAARQRDRWHVLLLAAVVLLVWNPYTLLDAGFQLSFAAVGAIFLGVRRCFVLLEGYPLPGKLAETIAVSTVCAAATAPVLWLQFHAVPLLAVPANALAAPAMAPLLALALLASLVDPIAPGVAAILDRPRRLVRGLAGAVRANRRLAAVRAGELQPRRVGRRYGCRRGRGLCLAAMPELEPVYLISGSDRPKIRTAVERLRNRFEDGGVEVSSVRRAFGRRCRGRLQRARPLRRRRATRHRRGHRGLESGRRQDRRRVSEEPGARDRPRARCVRDEEGRRACENLREARQAAHVRRAEKARAAVLGRHSVRAARRECRP